MSIYGDTIAKVCPVCGSEAFANIWKIPFSDVKNSYIDKLPLRKVPLLNSTEIYCYSQCAICASIFLNPYSSKYWDNRDNTHHVTKARERRNWSSYQKRVHKILNVDLLEYGTVIDIASGGCQCLTIMKELGLGWKRMIATDIRTSTVEYAQQLGYEGYLHDICSDKALIADGQANYVIFAEAFEHVQSPLIALQNISKMLAIGGYTFFTAIATEGCLPIRPGENIMTNENALMLLLHQCNLHVIQKEFIAERWSIIAQKNE